MSNSTPSIPVRLDFEFTDSQRDALGIHYALLRGYTYYDLQRALARKEHPDATHIKVGYNVEYNDNTYDVSVTSLTLLAGEREVRSFLDSEDSEVEVEIPRYSGDEYALDQSFIIPLSLL